MSIHTFVEVALLLAAIPATLYPLGLVILALQFDNAFTHDFSTALYAASLAPKTTVLWLGLKSLYVVAAANVFISCITVITSTFLFINSYRLIKLYGEIRGLSTDIERQETELVELTNAILRERISLPRGKRYVPSVVSIDDVVGNSHRASFDERVHVRRFRAIGGIVASCLFICIAVAIWLAGRSTSSLAAGVYITALSLAIFCSSIGMLQFSKFLQFLLSGLVAMYLCILMAAVIYSSQTSPSLPWIKLVGPQETIIMGQLVAQSDGKWYVFVDNGDLLTVGDSENVEATIHHGE